MIRTLWPYENGEKRGFAKLFNSLGKRISRMRAAADRSYALPSSEQVKANDKKVSELASAYFQLEAHRELLAIVEKSISRGVPLTEYYFLHRYLRERKPRHILELGSGITSIFMSHALWLNKCEDASYNGHIQSMESIQMHLEDTQSLLPANLAPFITFHFSGVVPYYWRQCVPTHSYESTPYRPYDFIFVDGPLAKLYPTGDHLRLVETVKGPVDIVADARYRSMEVLDRLIRPGHVFADYCHELSFAKGLTYDMLQHSPRMGMPLKHRCIYETFGLALP